MVDYKIDPSFFHFKKCETWKYMPMFEKILYYKDHINDYYLPYVDKISAKKIVSDLCGDKIKVPTIIRILDGPEDICENDLNTDHIIKSAHGSGWNINITDKTTVEGCKSKLKEWNRPYGIESREHHYKNIKPRFFIEEKICDKYFGKTGEAIVYMFRCLHGQPVTIGIRTKYGQNTYDIDKKRPIEKEKIHFTVPEEVDKMIELSKILSKPFEFVRIDFYLTENSDIYFSEFTFTPSAGNIIYYLKDEKRLGSLWK
jgi:hypothetical protein